MDAILAASAALAAVTVSVRAFAAMMNERRGRKLLEPWMNTAAATGEPTLRSFVTGLDKAITNAIDEHVEDHKCQDDGDDDGAAGVLVPAS